MRAITLWQPWAWLVSNGHKLVENRPWAPVVIRPGDRFAIHAGKRFSVGNWEGLLAVAENRGIVVPPEKNLPYGVILATAELVKTVRAVEDVEPFEQRIFYSDGAVGWILRDVRPLATPIACKGALGCWEVPAEIEAQILAAEGGK